MLSGINEFTLVRTFTHHCYRWFAGYGRPFMHYSSVAPFITLSSFAWTSKGIWKVFLRRVILFMPRDSRPTIFIMGWLFHQMSATFLSSVGRTCVPTLCFPCIYFVSFLSKETLIFSSFFTVRWTWSLKPKESFCTLCMVRLFILLDSIKWFILLSLGERLLLYHFSLLD